MNVNVKLVKKKSKKRRLTAKDVRKGDERLRRTANLALKWKRPVKMNGRQNQWQKMKIKKRTKTEEESEWEWRTTNESRRKERKKNIWKYDKIKLTKIMTLQLNSWMKRIWEELKESEREREKELEKNIWAL